MPDIRINKLKNRLYIFLQVWIPTELPAFVRKLESACLALIPGFTCLAVIPSSGLDHRRDRDLFSNTMDLISAYGAKKVVCVKAAGEKFSDRLYIDPDVFSIALTGETGRRPQRGRRPAEWLSRRLPLPRKRLNLMAIHKRLLVVGFPASIYVKYACAPRLLASAALCPAIKIRAFMRIRSCYRSEP